MKLRIGHLADLHLGFRQYGRQNAQGINQREADVALAFRRTIDALTKIKPHIIVVAGDVFHSVRPANPAILDAFNQFRRLRESLPDCPVVIVAGNHDTPRSVETGSILQLLEAVGDVHVIGRDLGAVRFPTLDLTVTGFPHASMVTRPRPRPTPDAQSRWNVLVQHGEIAGVVPGDRSYIERGGAMMELGDLHPEKWNYVALGHYHVASEVAHNTWYAGSLDYVTHDPWSELRHSGHLGSGSRKGWLLVELAEVGVSVAHQAVDIARRHIDLDAIQGGGLTAAEIDRLITDRVAKCRGGIEDQVVRQVVYDVPRTVARALDHDMIRGLKTRALHYRLDVRRPAPVHDHTPFAGGARQTLPELVEEYLTSRSLPPGMERKPFVELGVGYVKQTGTDESAS